jgi:NTE family protein
VHLGVIKAIEERGLRIDVVSGTSAGAIVGALYAYGHTPEQILKIIIETSFFKSVRPAWTWSGLLRLDGLREVLIRTMPDNSIERLKRTLIVAATDLVHGRPVYLEKGDLATAVLASSCVPGIFSPIEIEGMMLVDGGLLDNFPVQPLCSRCDFIIGSHCNAIHESFDRRSLKAIIERSLLLAVHENTARSKSLCHLLIEPPGMSRISGFELARADEMFDLGYRFAVQQLKDRDFQ